MDALDVIGLAAGGTTYGAVRAGFKIVGRLELPGGFGHASVEANRHLLGEFPIQTDDPTMWQPRSGISYVCGVPPCSGFSMLNMTNERAAKSGTSNVNFRGAASPINQCQRDLVLYASKCTGSDGRNGPEVVAFESVQGAYTKGLELMREYHALLRQWTGQDYCLYHLLHSDVSLGGAQLRPRYFWVASRVPFGVSFQRPGPAPTYAEVMGDLALLPQERGAVPRGASPSRWARELCDTRDVSWTVSNEAPRLRESLDALLPMWPEGTSVSAPLAFYAERNDGAAPPGAAATWWKDGKLNMFESNVRRVAGDRRGAWVIPGGCDTRFVHWAQPRFLSIREFARLMSLPDSWSFDYSKGVSLAANMVAKSCPVTSAEWVARAAAASICGERHECDPSLWEKVGEREYVFDVTNAWKESLPEGYDPKAHSQGSYAAAAGARRPARPAGNAPRAARPARPAQEAARRPEVALEGAQEATRPAQGTSLRPHALPEWGGMLVRDFWEFVHERQAVWQRREAGQARPWTDDPVMRERFFTNVFRELDPGTAVAAEIMDRPRPGWERLWNLALYRRFNREETWRSVIGYIPVDDALDLEGGLDLLKARIKERRAAKNAVFTDAHQIFPLSTVPGADLVDRVVECARQAVGSFPELARQLAEAADIRHAFKTMRNGAGPGISSFMGWQLTLDATLGPDPVVRAPVDWAPVTEGAKVGLVLYMNWPNYGIVGRGRGRTNGPHPVADAWKRFPVLDGVAPKVLEAKLLEVVGTQGAEFARRGLAFERALTPASVEHALCEWQKYVSIAIGGPSSFRNFDKEANRTPDRPAVKAVRTAPAAAAPEPTGGGQKLRRRVLADNGGSMVLPATEVQAAWLQLPGPTALARILMVEGRGDDEILRATKTIFGGRTEGPHLFTRTDLQRLRARLAKKGTA